MKNEHIFDTMERMESLIPDYSYRDMKNMVETDKKIRQLVISEFKIIKDYMFHVVQVSFELHKEKLTEASEDYWDDIKHLMNIAESSTIA